MAGDASVSSPTLIDDREPSPVTSPAARRLLLPVLLAAVCAEALFTGVRNMELSDSRSKYTMYLDDTADAVAYMNETEDGNFYRTEFRRFATINDASLYHYNGFSQFSSLEPGGISALMESLGVAATGNSFRYYDPSPLIDAIFSMKYIMNKNELYARDDRYAFVRQFGRVYLYENERVLPLGFLADPSLEKWSPQGMDPFTAQNTLLQTASGVEGEMFRITEPDAFSTENMILTGAQASAASGFTYELADPENLSAKPAVHAEFTSHRSQFFYLYVDAPNAIRFIYQHGNDRQDREISAGRSLIDVGWCEAGDTITADFELTRRGKFEKTYRTSGTVRLLGAGYDDAVFEEGYRALAARPLVIESFSDTRIEGILTGDGSLSDDREPSRLHLNGSDAEGDNSLPGGREPSPVKISASSDDSEGEEFLLFTSIPYSPYWKAYIDDKQVQTTSVGDDGLLAVRIPAGEHRICLVYRNRLLLPAVITSVLGLLLFLLYRKTGKVVAGYLW